MSPPSKLSWQSALFAVAAMSLSGFSSFTNTTLGQHWLQSIIMWGTGLLHMRLKTLVFNRCTTVKSKYHTIANQLDRTTTLAIRQMVPKKLGFEETALLTAVPLHAYSWRRAGVASENGICGQLSRFPGRHAESLAN